ncbi:non-ribosomal peptide synthetase [Nocardia harenae]|uniref:non-ribosomal peptide synthetase n=1 Tax=Nocardia harenae TaxID=358707 RepID=UPI0008349393|nr:non-ribosomal peptide synthetase [Nocardia harenae]
MLGKVELRDIVAADLGIAPEAVGFDDDLVSLGMHSMQLMRLAAGWRRRGYDIRSSALALEPTIDAWAELLAAGAPVDSAAAGSATATGAGTAAGAGSTGSGAVNSSASADSAGQADPSPEFPLATMQHAYWMGRRGDQALGGVAAHLFVEFDGAGADPERLRRAVARLVRRHEMLRAQFLDAGTQRILPEPLTPVFAARDLRTEPAERIEAELERMRGEKSHQRMDVAAGQVIDIALTLLPEGEHRLHLDIDMLAGDAQSYRRVLDDLATLYDADDDALPPLGITFRDYLAEKERTAADTEADRAWWAERLPDLPDIPALPVLPENERRDPARSVRLHHWFDAAARAGLHANAHGNGVTTAVTLATVFGEVIARWSARQRFLLNVPLFAREQLHDDIDAVVGDFTNSVLVEIDASRVEPVLDRARRVQRELHTCAAHAEYEGLDVLRDLGRLRGAPVTPSVVFTSGLDLGELFSERVTRVFGTPVWIISQGPQVDLDAQVAELDGGLLVNWDLRRDALPDGVAETMFAEFLRILEALAAPGADWSAPLAIPLPAAQAAVRRAVNDTAEELGERTLHHAFFELAQRHPERTALLRAGGLATSYGELAGQALAVARALTAAGVRAGDTVAVLVPKGHRQIPAVLGVLAAGAAYLPIGTDQPAARRDRILTRADVRVVLVDSPAGQGAEHSTAAQLGTVPARDGNPATGIALPAEITAIDLMTALSGPALDAPLPATPDSTAYVLFTSGSTGEPKGVEVAHRAAANTVDAIARRFGIGAGDRHIGLSALNFDLSVYDIFAPLSIGGALACVAGATERDAQAWAALIAEAEVSVVNAAPGLLQMLADVATPAQLRSIRLVLTGGDRVRTRLADRFRAAVPGLRFVGLGGTTETAIHSTVCEVTDDFPAHWDSVPYGTPLANVALRVVNQRGEDCPDLVPGELWIGGASVADGYRGDAERTADRFVEHGGQRWYRTGDLARYLPDGTVDFLGRADHQVKIRGYRVELGEVESALAGLPGAGEAVALVTDSGRLVAAVTADGSAAIDPAKLRDQLPGYMIPEHVQVLAEIPLTPNGKLDRAAIRRLLVAGDLAAATAFVPPADEVEAALAYITAQVLGLERIGVETDFFDVGGDSILATTLTAKVRGLLAVDGFGVSGVLESRTVRRIARGLLDAEPQPGRLAQVATILLELAEVSLPDPASVV